MLSVVTHIAGACGTCSVAKHVYYVHEKFSRVLFMASAQVQ